MVTLFASFIAAFIIRVIANDDGWSKTKARLHILAVILFIAAGILAFTTNNVRNNIRNNTYEAYLDGNKIDLNYIDISLYSRTYDDVNKRIYLTTRTR